VEKSNTSVGAVPKLKRGGQQRKERLCTRGGTRDHHMISLQTKRGKGERRSKMTKKRRNKKISQREIGIHRFRESRKESQKSKNGKYCKIKQRNNQGKTPGIL